MGNLFVHIQAFIQVMAAFNFAFATSNQFNNLLYDKVVFSIKNIKKKLSDFQSKIGVAKKTVERAYISNHKAVNNEEDLNLLKKNLNDFEEKNITLEKKVTDIINNISRKNFFMLICSYTGIYCLLILLYDGFKFFNHEQLLVFNILSLILFSILFIIELKRRIFLDENQELIVYIFFKKKTINYKTILVFFSIFILFSSLSVNLLHYKGYKCPVNIKFWVKLTTVILSSVHFIWYFILSIYNSQSLSKRIGKEIQKSVIDFDNFHKKNIEPAIIIANKLEKYDKQNK